MSQQQQITCIKRTLSEKWWLNVYLSNHIRIMRMNGDEAEYKFLYLLTNLSLRAENASCCQQIELDENMRMILNVSPIADKIRDNYIYFPLNDFTIRSNQHNGKTIKIKVYLIKDKEGNLIGLDFWTSQWFWGIFSSVFNLAMTRSIFRQTISEMSNYNELNDNIKKVLREKIIEYKESNDDMKQMFEERKKVEKPEYIPEKTIPIQTATGSVNCETNEIEDVKKWTPPSTANLVANFANFKDNLKKKKNRQ